MPQSPALPTGAGRYAPSPSYDLHIGNLRTAVLAWLYACSSGRRFVLRVDDLDDRARPDVAHRQLADLVALGLEWDGEVWWQSARFSLYDDALGRLRAQGLVFECYCSRRDVQEATRAPHAPAGSYPGTCRDLTEAERAVRAAAGKTPALRLRAAGLQVQIEDEIAGTYVGPVDDVVLRRADLAYSYHLATVVDDAAAGVDQVVRGDDLLFATPTQAHLYDLLGLPRPIWVHVPLVFNADGTRLAKRDRPASLANWAEAGVTPAEVLGLIAQSLNLGDGAPVTAAELLARWRADRPAVITAWHAPTPGSGTKWSKL